MKLVTTKFKPGGLHEKHVVATWKACSGNLIIIDDLLGYFVKVRCRGHVALNRAALTKKTKFYIYIYMYVQGDSKRWTQLNSKWRPNTRQTIGWGIASSLLAQRVDLRGLRSKLS